MTAADAPSTNAEQKTAGNCQKSGAGQRESDRDDVKARYRRARPGAGARSRNRQSPRDAAPALQARSCRGRRSNKPRPRARRRRSTGPGGGPGGASRWRMLTCALYTRTPRCRGPPSPLVTPFDRQRRVSPAPAVALTRPGPSLISRANRVPIPLNAAFHGGFGAPGRSRRHGATSGERNREADLSTEQACTQASSRFPRAHGHQRRTQGGGGTALARTQAAFRLTRHGVRAHCFHGTIEATGGLSGRGERDQDFCPALYCRRASGRTTGRCVLALPCRRRSAMRSSETGSAGASGNRAARGRTGCGPAMIMC